MAHLLLLAEPSLTIQRVVQLTFANEDIEVVVATDGSEAMALAERLHPAVVLADVSLGLHSGYEVASFIRRHPSLTDVRVVLLSGAFERVDHGRASEVGCDLVLAKPFDPQQLLSQVKALMGSGRPAESAAAIPAVEPAPLPAPQVPPPAPPLAAAPAAAPVREREPAAAGREPAPAPVAAPAPPAARDRGPVAAGPEPGRPGAGFLAPGFARGPMAGDGASPPEKPPAPAPEPDERFLFRRGVSAQPPSPRSAGADAVPGPVEPGGGPAAAPATGAGHTAELRPEPEPDRRWEWLPPAVAEPPAAQTTPPVSQPPVAERVPSFEMLALTNKGMHLVQPPEADEEAVEARPPQAWPPAEGGHDLGNLIPALDDYFDQLDAAFASSTDSGFRRPPDVPAARAALPASPTPPLSLPAPAVVPAPSAPPPSPVPVPPAVPVDARGPAVSPFSALRKETPVPEAAPAPDASSIDDAYDALMKQLRDPKPRSSVVALRADDELLLERAVERVLERLDPAAVRAAMEEVVTNLAKRVIQEEVERIRRP